MSDSSSATTTPSTTTCSMITDNNSSGSPKKRKKDEITNHNILLDDPSLENPNEKAALTSSDDIFYDMNPRWRRAYMQELHRQDVAAANKENDIVLLCPDDVDCTPADTLDDDDEDDDELSVGSSSSVFKTEAANVPKTPFTPYYQKDFIRTTSKKSSSDGGDAYTKNAVDGGDPSFSPCGVDGMEWGRVYFWHRSLAWSEDGDDNEPNSGYIKDNNMTWLGDFEDRDEIRQRLALPAKLGREYIDTMSEEFITRSRYYQAIEQKKPAMRSSFTPRDTLQQKEQKRNVSPSSSRAFHEHNVELDSVTTAIHWEEKVYDAMDLGEIVTATTQPSSPQNVN